MTQAGRSYIRTGHKARAWVYVKSKLQAPSTIEIREYIQTKAIGSPSIKIKNTFHYDLFEKSAASDDRTHCQVISNDVRRYNETLLKTQVVLVAF